MDSRFLKRLGWYLIGFSIGLVFLVFFVKKKSGETGLDICYFPNCRVLKDLRSKPISYAEGLEQHFSPDSLLWNSFFRAGNIDFGASDTEAKPCKVYHIENEDQKMLTVQRCPDKVQVVALKNP